MLSSSTALKNVVVKKTWPALLIGDRNAVGPAPGYQERLYNGVGNFIVLELIGKNISIIEYVGGKDFQIKSITREHKNW